MPLIVTRLLFILVLVAVCLAAADEGSQYQPLPLFVGAIGLSLAVIGLDLLIRRKSIATLSAIFFGLLAGLIM